VITGFFTEAATVFSNPTGFNGGEYSSITHGMQTSQTHQLIYLLVVAI
jgi:hypothetical protein